MKRFSWRIRSIVAGIALIMGIFIWAALARKFATTANTNLDRFDAILVLGTPADSDGNPTPEQLARVTEAVREYERGVAPRLLFTGGPAHNEFVEAQVMARTAAAQGIPPSAIFVESHAKDTIQNACFSSQIMQSHGWHSAEVVSSAAHLPRTALILSKFPLKWRTHAAPPLQPNSSSYTAVEIVLEVMKTARYLTYASWAESCEPQ